MDLSSAKWFSELGMDDYELNDSLDELTAQQIVTALGENIQQSFSSESYSSYPVFNPTNNTTTFSGSSNETSWTGFERPTKQLKTNSWNSSTTDNVTPKASSSPSQILSFVTSTRSPPTQSQRFYGNLECAVKPKDEAVCHGNKNFPALISRGSDENPNYAPKSSQGTKRVSTMTRTPSHAHDHIMAERKRREKLSERFIALSAIVPGLKKMDKASVLGDAIKYLKQLQERVKSLEEQAMKKTVESVVFVRKTQVYADDDISSSDENFEGRSDEALPEIEARVSDKNVLIRIHCEKHNGFVAKILGEIEKLHLSVVNSNTMPFGNYAMDITVIAQMDAEFCLTVKDLVRNLRLALIKFM